MDEQLMKYYGVREQPPLTQKQLELLEAGFKVEPNYSPYHYEESKGDLNDHISRIINTSKNT